MGSTTQAPRELKTNDWIGPEELVYREFNSLRGRLLAIIESAGLPQVQEKALKSLIKGVTYQQESILREMARRLDTGVVFRYEEKLESNG